MMADQALKIWALRTVGAMMLAVLVGGSIAFAQSDNASQTDQRQTEQTDQGQTDQGQTNSGAAVSSIFTPLSPYHVSDSTAARVHGIVPNVRKDFR